MNSTESLPATLSPPPRDGFSARDAMLEWVQAIAPYGILTTDAQLRIQGWNHWLAVHSGLSAEKVVGRPLFDVFPDEHTRRFEDHFKRALAGEVSVLSTALHKYLLPLAPTTGEFKVPHMLQTVRIAPLPAGDIVFGTITIIEDVTQRECQALILQRQQERDRLLSEALGILLRSANPLMDVAALFPRISVPLGLEAYSNYLYDAEAQCLRLNAMGGVPPKAKEAGAVLLLGEGLSGLCAQRREPLILQNLQGCPDPQAQQAKSLGVRSYAGFPLQIGDRLLGTLSFASYQRDTITADEIDFLSTIALYVAIAMDRALRENALHIAQRSLLEHADNLETKIAERTARLHETIAQLESFSYTVAHDLRAPIRALKGYCEILQADYQLPEEGNLILDRLSRASSRLDALTRDLLKFSKISRANVQLERIDLAEIVQDIMLLTPALQDNLLVIRGPLGSVWAQRTLLQQSLSNLFDNALKFVDPATRPEIVVRTERLNTLAQAPASSVAFNPATRRAESAPPFSPEDLASRAPVDPTTARVRIWVEDNGIGIAPESHEKIFGIFERVSGLDHIEGTGIGLAIVARAMEQMGGRCGVESTLGGGSRFWLDLAAGDGPAPVLGK